jgi:hypothetical protein
MRVMLSIGVIATSILLAIALPPQVVVATAQAQAQVTGSLSDSERDLRRKQNEAWLRDKPDYEMQLYREVSGIKYRQIRQDRVLGFGLGILGLLLLGNLVLLWSRQPAGSVKMAVVPQPKPLKPAAEPRPQEPKRERAAAVLDRLALLRHRAQLAAAARRQKRIEALLKEIEGSISADIETRRSFREALDALRQEAGRLNSEVETAARAPLAASPKA